MQRVIFSGLCGIVLLLGTGTYSAAEQKDSVQTFLAKFAAGDETEAVPAHLTNLSSGHEPSSAARLQAQYDAFFDEAETTIGRELDWLSRLQRYFQPLPELQKLKRHYRRLRAEHNLYLVHLDSVQSKLGAAGLAANFAIRLNQQRAAYTERSGAFFSAFEKLFTAMDAKEQGLGWFDSLQNSSALNTAMEQLLTLRRSDQNGSHQILRNTTLPYQSIALAAQPLQTEPAIIPSWRQQPISPPTLEDTTSNTLSEPILAKARDLQYDPIKIFEFVNSEIHTELYYGAMKGSAATLTQLAGNSTDQASLLIDLLRASGIPARYAFGVIKLPAEQLANMVGVQDVNQAMRAVRRAGIPARSVIEGGRLASVEIQHSWVSAYIPYANYRGATVDKTGQAWLPLMPALKQYSLETRPSLLNVMNLQAPDVQQEYFSSPRARSVADEVQQRVEQYLADNGSSESYADQQRKHILNVDRAGYIPNSLPAEVIAVTGEFAQAPESLLHQVRFVARRSAQPDSVVLLDVILPVSQLINRDVSISYQAGSQQMHNLALSLGGIANVPLFLLELRPRLLVQGQAWAVSEQTIAAGEVHQFTVELISPAGRFSTSKQMLAGGFHALAVGAQDNRLALAANQPDSHETLAGKVLNQVAQRYTANWTASENELAAASQRKLVRPLPSLVFASNDLQLESLLGEPQFFNWRGVSLDAAWRVTDSVAAHPQAFDEAEFTRLASLAGSWLEHDIFERYFNVASISADKGLALASEQRTPLLVLEAADSATLETQLALHPVAVIANVREWLTQQYRVTIPAAPLSYFDWQGSTWVVEDPQTGHAGYFIARGLAGGATAAAWANDLAEALRNYTIDEINTDPSAAARVFLFASQDYQITEADQDTEPLGVLVTDEAGRPVQGAQVTFMVASGAGKFSAEDASGNSVSLDAFTATTDGSGAARAVYGSPQSIQDSQIVSFLQVNQEDLHATEVGLSYINVSVNRQSLPPLLTDEFYTVITIPGPPTELLHLPQLGAGLQGAADAGLAFEFIQVNDRFGNRRANTGLTASVGNIRFPDTAVVVNPHKVLDTRCDDFPDQSSPCVSDQLPLVSDVYGQVRVGILFGSVVDKNKPEDVVEAVYPINVGINDGPSLELPYTAQVRARASLRGPSYYAAVAAGQRYLDSAQVKLFLDSNETAETENVVTRSTDFTGSTSFLGSELVSYTDMGTSMLASQADQKVDWKVSQTRADGGVAVKPESVVNTNLVSGLVISPQLPEPIKLGLNLTYTQFGDFTYLASPAAYQPFYAVLDIYEDNQLFSSQLVSARAGSLAQGKVTLPPLAFSLGKTYEGEFVFNKGGEFDEVKSARFAMPILAPIIRSVGGSGSLIVDEVNQASCVVKEPELILDLVQEAEVTVSVGASNFLHNRKLSAGRHVFGVSDTGFATSFLQREKTRFSVRARSTATGAEESRQAVFVFPRQDLANLPIGSPVYEDINLYRGNLFLSRTDIKVNDRGPDIDFTRSFSSNAVNAGSMGPGWSHNYDSYVQQTVCGWVTVSGGVSGGVTFFPTADGFKAGKGYHGSLFRATDEVGLEGGWDFFSKDGTRYHYAKAVRDVTSVGVSLRYYLSFIEDTNGNRTTLGYGPTTERAPELQLVRDSSNRQIQIHYRQLDEILQMQAPAGVQPPTENYVLFDSPRRLISHINGLGYDVRFRYDEYGRLIEAINHASQHSNQDDSFIAEQYQYNEPEFFAPDDSSVVDASIAVAMSKLTDPRGVETEYSYEKRISSGDFRYSSGTLEVVRAPTIYYVVTGFTKSDTLPEGLAAGTTRGEAISARFEYVGDAFDDLVSSTTVIDPRDVPYLYVMDRFGRNLSIDGPTGLKEMSWTVNDTLMLTSRDENGVLTSYDYDEHGNVISEEVTGPLGGNFVTTSTYTTKQNGTIKDLLQSRTDRRGNTTRYSYDNRGNLTLITHPASEACSSPCNENYTYFLNGDRSGHFDERGNHTGYRYDQYGNVVQTDFPIGVATAGFDERSRSTRYSDENKNTTRFEYDWLNRLVKQTNAEGGIRTFAWDANSNKVDEVDEEGRRMHYVFDFDNRVIDENTVGLKPEERITRSLVYDTNDNLLLETDFRGNEHVYEYDDANRRMLGTFPPNGIGLVKVVAYEYDNTSNVLTFTERDRDGNADPQITSYTYDNLYRQVEATDAEDGITKITYDGNDNVTEKIDELGRVFEYDYDTMNRKIAQRDAVGSSVERSMAWEYDRDSTLLKYIDARGNSETYVYDEKDRQVFKTNLDDNRFTYVYDEYGNLLEEFDHFGNRIAYGYDELHRRVLVRDQRNFETVTTFDLVGNPLTETWPNGNEIVRTFDFLDRLKSENDSIGHVMSYTYDDDSNKLSRTDGKGFVTNYVYDALDQLIEEHQPEGRKLLTEHDVFGNIAKSVDGVGNPTTFEYDRLNRGVLLTDADNKTVQSTYDVVDNKLTETDKRGNTWIYEYDALDRLTQTTEPAAGNHRNVIRNIYDANDNLIQTTDKRNIVTDYDYDRLNRVIEERRSGIVVVKNAYSEIGDLIGLEDANGNKTAFVFNGRHEMTTESRPEFAISQYEYDEMGDVTTHTDPEGRVMIYEYDKRRRKVSETNNDSDTTIYTYDLNNNRTKMIRPLTNQWQYHYDELNRLTGTTDGEGNSNAFTYDAQNNLLSHTDANGNLSRYEYDVINRKDKMFYPEVDGITVMCDYSYDPNDNLKVEVDANGQIHTHTYDSLNRLTRSDHTNPLVTIGRDLTTVTMEYDGNNNVIGVTETYALIGGATETRTETKTWDDFDRLYDKTDSWNKTLKYRYDLNGNRTSLTDSDEIVTTYQYDGLNRVKDVTTVNGRTEYRYDKSSLLSEVIYPNNTQASYEYDPAKRTQRIHNQQNNATVSNFEYEYDDNGNRIEQREINGGAQEVTTYQYDLNDRLTEVDYLIGLPEQYTATYTYDPAYNRISEVHTSDTPVNKTYTYNARNQLTDIDDNLDVSNDVSYTFDANGNQTSKVKGTETTDYIFDIRDHLRQVKIGGSTVGQFLYDYDGLRIEKLGERGAERSTFDYQSVLQQHANDNTTRAKFDYGPDRLLSLNTDNEPPSFYLCDALQSVVNLTNNQGAIQARYQYDAWGIKRSEAGTSYNRFAFTGYEEDKETGLLYAKARHYDPDTGKFLSEDAWEGDNLIAPSLHKYLYVYQNPTIYIDRDGNEARPAYNFPIDDSTIQIPTIGVIDTGNQATDDFLAGAASLYNLGVSMINAVPAGLNAPLKVASALTETPQEHLESSILAHQASTGPIAPFLIAGTSPLTIGPKLKRAATATGNAIESAVDSFGSTGQKAKLVAESENRVQQRLLSTDVISDTSRLLEYKPRPNFYVGPAGPEATLPSTAYRYDRYLNDDGTINKWGRDILETGEGRVTYFGFNKFETGKKARDAFQIKGKEHINKLDPDDSGSWSDARLRSEFDTLQLYDNSGKVGARVPKRLGNDFNEPPEPFTEAYPEFGAGGERQLILNPAQILKHQRTDILPEE